MGVESTGKLTLDADYLSRKIVLDPYNQTITINGTPVLTSSSGASTFLALRPNYILSLNANTAGSNSIAIGSSATASGSNAAAFGSSASATGTGAIALGASTQAQGSYAFAGGPLAKAHSTYSVALGYNSWAYGSSGVGSAMAIGSGTVANKEGASAFGYLAKVYARNATALGNGTIANGFGQTVVGSYNLTLGNPDATGFDPGGTDPVFIVGNGAQGSPSNALTIRKDAATAIGEKVTASAAGQVVVGKYNDLNTADTTTVPNTNHTQGVFIVGAGQLVGGVEQRKNAIRVTANGAVLVQPGGDLLMGEFTNGEKP
jgi:hypothetical protein